MEISASSRPEKRDYNLFQNEVHSSQSSAKRQLCEPSTPGISSFERHDSASFGMPISAFTFAAENTNNDAEMSMESGWDPSFHENVDFLPFDDEAWTHPDSSPWHREVTTPSNNSQSGNLKGRTCFGTICDIGIRFRRHPALHVSQLPAQHQNTDGREFVILPLSFEDSRCILRSHTNSEIATLNTKTFDHLQSIQKSGQLELEGVLPVKDIESLTRQAGFINGGLVTTIGLNVYGIPEVSDDVAKELSRNGLFLQDPDHVPEATTYENPQCLKLPAHAMLWQRQDVGLSDEGASNTFLVHDSDSAGVEEDIGLEFDVLLDRFTQHSYLARAAVDGRIITPLLDHQKEGLDFVVKREALSSPQLRGLWELEDEHCTEQIYQHLITGAKSRGPQDTYGGVLADDMGLGKSLVMLSAIAGSLDPALTYAKAMTSAPGSTDDPMIAAKSTLLVVPSTLLIDNWIEEIQKHTIPYTLTHYKYHGQSRNTDLIRLLSHDIVLTTYGTVAAEFKRRRSHMHQIKWYRIILDEAHMIRNASTNQFRAVTALSGHIRWCLTGTPIQNSLDDLGSLVVFLRLPILDDAAQFKRHITRQTSITNSSRQPDFDNLRLLLGAICLRRNKGILCLSRSEDFVHQVEFSWDERRAYEELGHAWREALNMAVSGHKSKEAHQTVLEALLRMRIFCNNGDFYGNASANILSEPDELGSLLQQDGQAACYYCSCDISSFGKMGDSSSATITACHHAVCGECSESYEEQIRLRKECPICSMPHMARLLTSSEPTPQLEHSPQRFPPKLKALCEDIEHHKSESKSIVFSFWKKSLDIVGIMLAEKRFAYLRVDGTLPFSQRKRILAQFQAAEQGMVLLMTLGTGAVGLNNLSVANRIHILEPQWNPSIESQAIGRVLRLGQTKTVHVIRYIVTATVEINVQNGQLRKLHLAKSGFGAGKAEHIKKKALMLKDLICPTSIPE